MLDPDTRVIDFDDDRYTEHAGGYPLSSIPNASTTGVAGSPSNVIMLTADAFGVLPPVARLTTDQALLLPLRLYIEDRRHRDWHDEPVATFSAGFGAPFCRRPAATPLLAERLDSSGAQAWLVNTGWTGGPYGVGQRMPIEATRSIITAILDGSLQSAEWVTGEAIGLSVPVHCPGVPDGLLRPRDSWIDSAAYDATAEKLAGMFAANFAQFLPYVSEAVAMAGPARNR
ncbi:MAG: phosphoenolpyruvate carboxykinase (ATP) [Thermomicrobiales bacterium]